ncbi:PKS-NRPS hybrid synthetase CHGG_01239-like [Papaver somniferum]|uniref:PKS-NRPS hybrid synthetase CHGG_01239-like n=1 Tax=Papaver somniferum TaxID=3469 RepID=UPI000E6FCD41|nr:PKS-NRPS hybrid synthetase CHGG_01239-like [Papaver somniferum]
MRDSNEDFDVGESSCHQQGSAYLDFYDSQLQQYIENETSIHENPPSQTLNQILNQISQEGTSVEERREETNDTSSPNNQMVSYPWPAGQLGPDTSDKYATDLEFTSKEEAINWAKETALKNKCVLVRNTQGKDIRFEMTCERAGSYAKNSHKKKDYVYEKKANKNYKTITRKDGCPFKLVFNWKGNAYKSKVWNGRHNHPDPDSFVWHCLVAKLKPHEFAEVERLYKRGTAPSKMLLGIKAKDPDNVSSLSTIYSAQVTIRRERWQGRKVMQEFLKLATDHNYTHTEKVGPDGEVLQIFLAHPLMAQLAQSFFPVLIMDCTYKTNKYHMPLFNIVGHTSDRVTFTLAWCFMRNEKDYNYIWELNQLKLLFRGNDLPRVIITDYDDGLMYKLSEVFPYAQNFLCTFHIVVNVNKNCHAVIEPPKADIKNSKKEALEEEVRFKLLSPEDQEEERKKIQEQVDEEHKANHDKWLSFIKDLDSLVWFITETRYEENLKKFIDRWNERYPSAVSYSRKNWLDPLKQKFVRAWTNRYRNYGNESTSIAESAHGRLKKLLDSNQENIVTVTEAMEQYFKNDIDRITKAFQKSSMERMTTFLKHEKFLRGIEYNVSHWAIEHMMKELDYEIEKGRPGDMCICTSMSSLGLPCQHMLIKYKEVIPLEYIDPFWKQLSFTPPPTELVGESPWETNEGIEFFNSHGTSATRQILLSQLRLITRPWTRDLNEPIIGKPPGRPQTQLSRTKERKILKKTTGREVERQEKTVPKKRGRPKKEVSTSTPQEDDGSSQPTPKKRQSAKKGLCTPMQTQQDESAQSVQNIDEAQIPKRRRERPRKFVYVPLGPLEYVEDGLDILTLLHGDRKTPRDPKSRRPSRSYHTKIQEYMNQLPEFIREYIIYTDDVDGDGNCGFYAATEQLGYLSLADNEGLTQWQYARRRMAATLIEKKRFYEHAVDDEKGFKNLHARVLGPKEPMAFLPSEYWMQMPVCGHLLADTFNCVVHYFSPTASSTFTPKWQKCEGSLKKRRMALAFVNENHFIILKLKENCPLPPVCAMTKNKEVVPNYSNEWMELYEDNHQLWDALDLSIP